MMSGWTLSVFKDRFAAADLLDLWLEEIEEDARGNIRAIVFNHLAHLCRLEDWSVLNESRKPKSPFFKEMTGQGRGLSRIRISAMKQHHRLIGFGLPRSRPGDSPEYVIVGCGTKDNKGTRSNPGFYNFALYQARKQLILEEGNYRNERVF